MFKVLTDGCEPTRGTKYSACIDLYASEDVTIGAGETKLVGLGVAIDSEELAKIARFHTIDNMPTELADVIYKDYIKSHSEFFYSTHYLQLMLRSSLSKELIIANGVGVIDLDYKDEIKIRLHNPIHHFSATVTQDNNEDLGMGDDVDIDVYAGNACYIKKGACIAQITLVEHKSYLFGIESDTERNGGFGSTNKS